MTIPRIAFVLTQDRGGPVDVTVALAGHLAGTGKVEVRLFAPPPARGAADVAGMHETMQVAAKQDLRALGAARRRILAWRPDVVHAQDRRSGLVCIGLGRRAGRGRPPPHVVHTYHGVPDDVTQEWFDGRVGAPAPSSYSMVTLAADAMVARTMDCTIVPAPAMQCFLRGRLRVPADRVLHIDNGIHLLDPAPPDRVTRFVFIGALIARKGVDQLLPAFARAHAVRPDLRLQVVGDGSERGRLEQLAAATGISAAVEFSGFRPDIRTVLAEADAFVLPSRMEQQPLVLIEAMSAGVPVIATAVGGVPDMLAGTGPGALVVPPADVPALTRAMVTLADLVDPASAGRDIAAAARTRFSVAAAADHHLELYLRLMQSRRAGLTGRHHDR